MARAQVGLLGQLFLGQARCHTVALEEHPKGRRHHRACSQGGHCHCAGGFGPLLDMMIPPHTGTRPPLGHVAHRVGRWCESCVVFLPCEVQTGHHRHGASLRFGEKRKERKDDTMSIKEERVRNEQPPASIDELWAQVRLTPASGAHPTSCETGDLFVDSGGHLRYCFGGVNWKRLA
jgi:hypothetical protein